MILNLDGFRWRSSCLGWRACVASHVNLLRDSTSPTVRNCQLVNLPGTSTFHVDSYLPTVDRTDRESCATNRQNRHDGVPTRDLERDDEDSWPVISRLYSSEIANMIARGCSMFPAFDGYALGLRNSPCCS